MRKEMKTYKNIDFTNGTKRLNHNIRNSVRGYLWFNLNSFIIPTLWNFAWNSVRNLVQDSICDSIWRSVYNSVWSLNNE